MIPLGISVAPGSTNSHTGDTNEITLGNIAVPPNIMGPLGIIRITAVLFLTNNANVKTFTARLATLPDTITGGGTNLITQTSALVSAANAYISLLCRNLGVTNSQACISQITTPAAGGQTQENLITIDTTLPLFICLNGALASAGDTIILRTAF